MPYGESALLWKGARDMALHFKKILVPYDGSDHAKKALAQAVALAEESGATILLATVCQMMSASTNAFELASAMGRDLVKELRGKCEAALAEGAALIPENIPFEKRMPIGSAGPMLEELAEKEHCDLIVMGSRGLGPLKSAFLGSVSSWLVSHSSCAILIVK